LSYAVVFSRTPLILELDAMSPLSSCTIKSRSNSPSAMPHNQRQSIFQIALRATVRTEKMQHKREGLEVSPVKSMARST